MSNGPGQAYPTRNYQASTISQSLKQAHALYCTEARPQPAPKLEESELYLKRLDQFEKLNKNALKAKIRPMAFKFKGSHATKEDASLKKSQNLEFTLEKGA